jgi:ferredoxin
LHFAPNRYWLSSELGKVQVVNGEACIACGQCELRCPDYAIFVDRKVSSMNKPRLMQGNEACAEGAIAAGVRFFRRLSDHAIHRNRRDHGQAAAKVGGKFVQMEDEIASMGAILGASLAGRKCWTLPAARDFP